MSAPEYPAPPRSRHPYHPPPQGYPTSLPQQQGYFLAPLQVQPKNGMGTTGFVLGLLAALLALVPIIGVVAWPLSILGLVFGIIGITRVSKRVATNKGLSVSGTVLAAFGLVLCIGWAAAFGNAVNDVSTVSAADPAVPAAPAEEDVLTFGETWTSRNGNTVTAGVPELGASESPIGDSGLVVRVPVTITNNGDAPWNTVFTTFGGTMNGAPAPETVGEGDWLYSTPLAPGASVTLTKVFEVDGPGEFLVTVSTPHGVAFFTGKV